MTDEKLKQAAEMYTEEYYFETPVQFFMAGADIGSREINEELRKTKFRLMMAESIIKELLDLRCSVSSAKDVENRFAVREKANRFLEEEE